MSLKWGILILAIIAFCLIDGGKYAGMVALTALMPIYSLALASVSLAIFIIVACIAVPIGRFFLYRHEPGSAAPVIEHAEEEERQAA